MRFASLLCAAVLSVACGVDPTTPPPVTFNSFSIDANQIACETQYRCCGTQCPANDATFNRGLARTQRLIDAGLLKFDPQAAQSCLTALAEHDQNCDVPVSMTTDTSVPCAKYLIGATPVGMPCDQTIEQCVPSAYCNGAVCTAYLNSGDSCATGGVCGSGLFCDTLNTKTCKPLAQSGQSCAAVNCDPQTKLVCLPTKLCGMPQADGALCAMNNQCLNNRCFGSGTAPMTCQPPIIPAQTLRDQVCALR
jgi:hypothetical protein